MNFKREMAGACLILILLVVAAGTPAQAQYRGRDVVESITTNRLIPGQPYDLLGKRIVFTTWHFIQPGDLDWVDKDGKSVYVSGDEAPDEAMFVGIEPPKGIEIVAQVPHLMGPIEMPSRMILQEGNLYKGWNNNEYFESTDAIHWEKKADLILDKEKDGIHHIFVDPRSIESERYKAVWTDTLNEEEFTAFREKRPDGWEPRALLHFKEKRYVSCLRGSVSPDGIAWKTLPDPLVVEYADTLNTCYYDLFLEKYVLYTRYWSVGPRTNKIPSDIRTSWTGVGRRSIGRSESSDFVAFNPSELILEQATDEMLPSEVLYTNCHTTIPGAPDQHLMFPAVWNASVDDTTRIVMAASNDGKYWQWVPGGNLLETGPFGQWNGGCIWVRPEMIELPDGGWALPYLAHNVPHKYPRGQQKAGLGYAVWPKSRLVALEAKGQGQFTMMPIMAPGRTLKINANTKRTGSIRVEVVGVSNRSFEECTPIFGDQFWTTVQWKGETDLGFEKGEPVTLRFKLDQAEIYGLQFE